MNTTAIVITSIASLGGVIIALVTAIVVMAVRWGRLESRVDGLAGQVRDLAEHAVTDRSDIASQLTQINDRVWQLLSTRKVT